MPPEIAQPRKSCVRGLSDRSLHIKMENRLGRTRPNFCYPPPAGITGAGGSISANAFANEIDVGVILVGWPVALEIVEKGRPVER